MQTFTLKWWDGIEGDCSMVFCTLRPCEPLEEDGTRIYRHEYNYHKPASILLIAGHEVLAHFQSLVYQANMFLITLAF